MSRITQMSHVILTHRQVRIHHFIHINESCHTYVWMRHVTHTNESCDTYKRVTSHMCRNEWVVSTKWVMSQMHIGKYAFMVWMSHVAHMNTSRYTWSHTWMSHVTNAYRQVCIHHFIHIHKSCHTYIWMRHVTHMNESVTRINESRRTCAEINESYSGNESCHKHM